LVLTTTLVLASVAVAAGEVEDKLRAKLGERLPGIRIESVTKLPQLDLYEVVSNGNRIFPLPQLHPDGPRKARAVWCATDPGKAWDALMLEGTEPAAPAAECKDPIADVARLADQVGIQGTPGLVFSNGKLVPGAISVEEIERYLSAPGKS